MSKTITDQTIAQLLITEHQDTIRYVPNWGWLSWDGQRWLKDSTNQLIHATHLLLNNLSLEAADNSQSKKNSAQPAHSASTSHILAILDLARCEPNVTIPATLFDADPFLLNVANGTVNLRTGIIRPHNRLDFITHLIPLAYDPQATSPLWQNFLDQITNSNQSLQSYLQTAIGYSITASTREEAIFILHGPGRNGKSRFMAAINDVLGDYAQHTPPATFTHAKNITSKHLVPVNLIGSRFVSSGEVETTYELDASLIKRITSGEYIFAHQSFYSPYAFQPQFKLWLTTNHLPSIADYSIAIWQRLKIIPFTASFLGREDRQLGEKLKAESVAILTWAIQGCQSWLYSGLTEPSFVTEATTTYRHEQDNLLDFLQECCVLGENYVTRASHIYQIYEAWCRRSKRPPTDFTTFGRLMIAHGFRRERKNIGKIYHGIRTIIKDPGPQNHTPVQTYSEQQLAQDIQSINAALNKLDVPDLEP